MAFIYVDMPRTEWLALPIGRAMDRAHRNMQLYGGKRAKRQLDRMIRRVAAHFPHFAGKVL